MKVLWQDVSWLMLDNTFRHQLDEHITNNLLGFLDFQGYYDIYRMQSIIKYKDNKDFWFGFLLGQLQNASFGLFKERYKHSPTHQDADDINEIIEMHYSEIRNTVEEKFKQPK